MKDPPNKSPKGLNTGENESVRPPDADSDTTRTTDGTPQSPASFDGGAGPPKLSIFQPGQILAGRYRIVRLVGKGGMGEVYDEDYDLKQRVALKTIRQDNMESTHAVSRFKREINLARKVTHSAVCRIYDLGTHRILPENGIGDSEKTLFLTMELLDGETLHERIRRFERLTTAEALPIVEQLVGALSAAHNAGIIHRDFKTKNIILVPSPDRRTDARAVVTDFGLARSVPGRDAGEIAVSETGAFVGTPAYMAPEQIEGGPLTPAVDIYALGIVMYEMVTGVLPFRGRSSIIVAAKRLTEAPKSPRHHVPDLDATWESVILRCLERDPAARFTNVLDVRKELGVDAVTSPSSTDNPLRSAVTPRPAPDGAKWSKPAAAALVLTGLLAAIVFGYSAPKIWTRVFSLKSGGSIEGEKSAAVVRRSIAVLDLNNVSGLPDAAWIGTAVSVMLATELAAGEELRCVPGAEVAGARKDLGLVDTNRLARDDLRRLGSNLGADMILSGSYVLLAEAETRLLRLDLRIQSASTGETLASAGGTGMEAQLFELVYEWVELSAKTRSGRSHPGSVARSRGDASPGSGSRKALFRRAFTATPLERSGSARFTIESYRAADPEHPLPHAALAAAWSDLGYEEKAQDSAARAIEFAGSLSSKERQLIEARFQEISKDWDRAIESYRSLLFRLLS